MVYISTSGVQMQVSPVQWTNAFKKAAQSFVSSLWIISYFCQLLDLSHVQLFMCRKAHARATLLGGGWCILVDGNHLIVFGHDWFLTQYSQLSSPSYLSHLEYPSSHRPPRPLYRYLHHQNPLQIHFGLILVHQCDARGLKSPVFIILRLSDINAPGRLYQHGIWPLEICWSFIGTQRYHLSTITAIKDQSTIFTSSRSHWDEESRKPQRCASLKPWLTHPWLKKG